MNNDLFREARGLTKSRVRHLHPARGRRVECLSGSLWLTQEGDRRDIVLAPGEGFAFDREGDVLISALADSRYLLLDESDGPRSKLARTSAY